MTMILNHSTNLVLFQSIMVDQVDHEEQDRFPNRIKMLINDHLYLSYVMEDIEHHHDQQEQYDHHQL